MQNTVHNWKNCYEHDTYYDKRPSNRWMSDSSILIHIFNFIKDCYFISKCLTGPKISILL